MNQVLGFVGLIVAGLSLTAVSRAAEPVTSPEVLRLIGQAGNLGQLTELQSNPCKPDESADAARPGCFAYFEDFCSELYSRKNDGKLDLELPNRVAQIRYGNAANGQSLPFQEYSKAKLAARSRLPQDLLARLEAEHYFEKLNQYIQGKPYREMNEEERRVYDHLSSETGTIWNTAFEATATARLEKLHPGASRLEEYTPEIAKDSNRTKNELNASVYQTIWGDHPKWKQVEEDFRLVKAEYIQLIQESAQIDPPLKTEWIARIGSSTLKMPGGDPKNIDHECATIENNAFNDPSTSDVTVCAGLFTTSGSSMDVLAHELSHSLGTSRSRVLFERTSELGKRLFAVQESICKKKGCPEDWKKFKGDFPALLGNMSLPKLPKEELFECLQYHKIEGEPSAEFLAQHGKSNARSYAGYLADRDIMARLTEKEIVLQILRTSILAVARILTVVLPA